MKMSPSDHQGQPASEVDTALRSNNGGTPKRSAIPASGYRAKRAKYASAACTQCRKGKVKCIRLDGQVRCQRCNALGEHCIINASLQTSQAKDQGKSKDGDELEFANLRDEVASLRRQVEALSASVNSLQGGQNHHDECTRLPSVQHNPTYANIHNERSRRPQEPHFVGPTRSAFSFNIAGSSLVRMGIPTDTTSCEADGVSVVSSSPSPEPLQSPTRVPKPTSLVNITEPDCLLDFSKDELVRLLGIFQDEVVCVHPFIETRDLIDSVPQAQNHARSFQCLPSQQLRRQEALSSKMKDLHMLKIAIAIAIVHEARGRNDVSLKLMNSVAPYVYRSSNNTTIQLKDLQTMTMLSLYHFHDDEELLAWRTIGTAARHALEMGLHQRQSLMDNFKDDHERSLANRAFWCVYALDRRWSFGISLPFALIDRDIDPKLPEPGAAFPYLQCVVAYSKLCSKVWEALPPLGSTSHSIPKETEEFLDFVTQNWLATIPQELQLKHPRLGLAPRSQPRELHRLRVLLHLRGNHMRSLIHRHHVLSTANIAADGQGARLVVDIAQDSIQVLIHLNKTTNIYTRQQSVFNYYLVSALAIIMLAVCHAPNMFAEPCKESFLVAVDLVKGFSRHGTASRRLWKSIKGLLPGVESLSLQTSVANERDSSRTGSLGVDHNAPHGTIYDPWVYDGPNVETDIDSSVPDLFHMSDDLMNLFDVFGQSATTHVQTNALGPMFPQSEQGCLSADNGEISRRFQGLI